MEENWIKQYWRPAIAWQYFAVCVCDFIIFPLIAFHYNVTWNPLTLKEGGFYHMAMAAIIGVSAWTRGQEKLKKLVLVEEEIKKNGE